MLTVVASVLVVLILLLAIPIDLVLSLNREQGWRGRIVVYSLFGLVRTHIRVGRTRKGRRQSLRKTAGRLVGQRRRLLSMLRSKGFVKRLVSLITQLIRTLKPRRFRLNCVVGLENPADTGRLVALFAPLKVLSKALRLKRDSNTAIQVLPDFTGPRFTGHICTSVHFVPLKLLGILLSFVFSAPVLRAAKAAMFNSGS